MELSAEDYAHQLKQLLPPGKLFSINDDSNLNVLLMAWGVEFLRAHNLISSFMSEIDLTATTYFLDDFERLVDLPFDCYDAPVATQSRRDAILNVLTWPGSNSVQELTDYCSQLGFPTAYVANGDINEFFVYVPDVIPDIMTVGDTAATAVGTYMRTYGAEKKLECEMLAIRPAHTVMYFIYSSGPTQYVLIFD